MDQVGVGALIKESLLSLYSVETIDKSFDGTLWLVLSLKVEEKKLLFVCFISHQNPLVEGTVHRRVSTCWLLKFSSIVVEDKCLYVVTLMQDVVTLLTTQLVIILKNQVVIDTIVNSFGVSFIGLLKDVGMCIVNGRGKPELDNFTSVSSRGKAVVDYCITSYTYLDHVIDF